MSDTDDHEFTIEDQKTKHQSNTNRSRPKQAKDVAWQRNEDERLLKDAGVDADMTEEERKEILEALRQSLPGEKLHQRIISIVGDGPKMQTVDQEQSSNIDVTIEDNDPIDVSTTSFLNNARTRISKRKIISDMEDKTLLELGEMQKRKKIASHKDYTEDEIDIFIRESVEFDDRDSSRSLQSRALKNQIQAHFEEKAQLILHHSNSLSLTAMCEKTDKAEEPCQSSQDLFDGNLQREERADANRLSLFSLRHQSHDNIIIDSESEDAVDTLEMVDDEFETQPPEESSCSPNNGIQEMDENKMQEKSGEGEEGKESNEDCNSPDNVDQATQVENQTIDTQNADRICESHSSELKSQEQDKNEKVDLSPLPYDDRFIWSQAQTYRLLERKYRRKQSPLGNTYFCPTSNLNPANYTTVIMQLIDIYLTRFTHFQDSLENYLPWGKPVHVGRHHLKTIDIKKRNEQFEVGDSFISGQFKTERFVVDHNLPSTSTAFREEDIEKSSISKIVGDQENSLIRSRKTINSKESDDFGEKMSGISEDMNAENDQTSNDAAWNMGNRIRSGPRTKKERAISEKTPALTQPVRHSARINLNTNQNSNSFVEDSSNNSDMQVNMCDERVTPFRTSSRTLKSNNKTEKNLGLSNPFQTPDGGDVDSNLINRKRKNKKNDDEESDVHSLSTNVHSKKIKDASSSANINFSCQAFYSDSKSEFLPTAHSMPVTPSRSLLMEHSLHKTSNGNYSATDSLRSGSPIEDVVVIKSKVATPLRTRRFFDTGSRTTSSVHSAEESDIANECSTATHAQTAGDFQERRTRKRTQIVDERAQSIDRNPTGSALPKKAALAEAQEKLVSCPLCNKAFSQDIIEEHASSCQDDDVVASDDEVERQQNTRQRCLRDYRIPRKTVTVERVQQNAKQLGSSDDSDRDNDSSDPDFVLTKDDNRTVQEDDDEKQFSSPVKSFRRISETTNSQLNYQNQFHRKRDSRRGRSKK